MKIYYVYNTWDSGDHEKGFYRSPSFLNREHAEQFLKDLNGEWDSGDSWACGPYPPNIVEEEILTEPIPSDKVNLREYCHTVYT